MKLHPRYRRGETECGTLNDHAVLLGYGRAGARTLQFLKEYNIPAIVVDDDAAIIRKLIKEGTPCIQADGSDAYTLELAHCRQARVVFCSMRRPRDAKMTLKYLRGSNALVLVRTFEADEIAMVEAAGGIAIKSAQASSKTFVEWVALNLAPKSPATKSD
jgi:CPA2 family monovalent cation:H+ antiporter-2